MRYQRFRLFLFLPFVLLVICFAFAGVLLHFNRTMGLAQFGISGAALVLYIVWVGVCRRDLSHLLLHIETKLEMGKKKSIHSFPLPVVVTDAQGAILLFNRRFEEAFLQGVSYGNGDIGRLIPGIVQDAFPPQGVSIAYRDRFYTAYYDETIHRDSRTRIFYFVDDTALKETSIEYEQSRPYLMLMSFDGLSELQKNYSSNDFAEIRMRLDQIVGKWAADMHAVYDKLSGDQYVVVAEKRNIDTLKTAKFQILKDVRSFTYQGSSIGVSLSVGISSGDTYASCEYNARQALDMAQSRGGDQVALRETDGSYEFFGGLSKGIEKTNKVRTRIVASSVAQLIRGSKNVMIMGHRFPDLDAMGAAVALCTAASSLEVPAYIVTDPQKSLAKPLIARMEEAGRDDCLLTPEEALVKIGWDTLLIVVDTHIGAFTEVPDLLEKSTKIVVIDHHRKSVQFIDNAVLFFHDPAASSASEMVTELLQYFAAEPVIGALEADALLSGIMLDTRSFVLRAGVRTFEAAAYLKSRGADTVAVKKLFASTLENYKQRNAVIADSLPYRGCAIACTALESPDIRIIASQAADELLGISDVDASFVLFTTRDCVNISARSLGKVNVQVVMESLGGGGHQTMAACQLKDLSPDEAVVRLKAAIDAYYETLN